MPPQELERETELEQLVQRADRGDRQAVRHLVAMLAGAPSGQHEATLALLAGRDDPAFWQDLLAYLAGEGWQQRRLAPPAVAAQHALQRLFVDSFGQPFPSRQAVLHAALTAEAPPVRALAAMLLGKQHDRTAIPALVTLLADPVPVVRVAAAHALQAMPDLRAVEALLAAMNTGDLGVRLAAADALGAVGHSALPALLRRLINQPAQTPFRAAALHALPHLAGGAAPQDIAALEAALHGPAAGSTVPVAADQLLVWCERRPAAPC